MIRSTPRETKESTLEGGRGIVQKLLKWLRAGFHGIGSTHASAIAPVVASTGKHNCRVHGVHVARIDTPRVPEYFCITKEVRLFPWQGVVGTGFRNFDYIVSVGTWNEKMGQYITL